MQQQLKDEWLKALRSGDYTQGTGALRNGNKFCCLGVLCDVYPEGEWKDDTYLLDGDEYCSMLPEDIKQAAMLKDVVSHRLMHMNDREGHTFSMIAKHIEEYL